MIKGNLLRRIKLYSKRLFDNIYDCPNVFVVSEDWPGDFPGRTFLALTSLYLSLDDNQEEKAIAKNKIDILFNEIKGHLNEDYFFGQIYDSNHINEQQLSGNGWYIRGLSRYYEITHDEKVYKMIKTISEKLLIPLAKEYKDYPLTLRKEKGDVSGHIIHDNKDKWILSSDVGCAYILLDGYVSAYEVLKDESLKDAIKLVIDAFEKADVVNVMFQTHATLTATRGILRFYQATKEEKYLKLAIKMFDIYQKEGMTDDFENINWFMKENGRTWTEPCCVVDSFILAKHLYLITKEVKYLKTYNRIYINGVRTFQRNNGGAGCSTIIRHGVGELKIWMYEAFFCCSLREGEGFYELASSVIKDDNSYLFLIDEGMEDENINVDIDLYEKKIIHLDFKKDLEVLIYVPDGIKTKFDVKDNILKIKGHKGESIDIDFELDVIKDEYRYLYGDMLLTQKEKHIDRLFKLSGNNYSYIYNSSLFSENELKELVQKL